MHASVQAVMYKFGFSDVRRKAGQECNFRITAIASIAHAHLHSPLIVIKGCHVNLKGTIFLVVVWAPGSGTWVLVFRKFLPVFMPNLLSSLDFFFS